jgi:CHAD domain-containing protein
VASLGAEEPGVLEGSDIESVHHYRVATRRLRSDLRTFQHVLDRATVDGLRDDLRWLGDAVGAVRDLDVLGQRIAAAGRDLPERDQPAVAALVALVADADGVARVTMVSALGSDRYRAVRARLTDIAEEPPWLEPGEPPRSRAGPVVRRVVRTRWRRAEAAAAAVLARDPPVVTDAELHHVRILTKRIRYASDAAVGVFGKAAARFAHRLAAVQDVLGDHQDTVVAEEWLRNAAAAHPELALAAGQLVARERTIRGLRRGEFPSVWHRAARPTRRAWFA